MASFPVAWADLSERALEDNVYYAPRYAQALLDTVAKDAGVQFAAVWENERLIGLLPFTRSKVVLPMLQPTGRAWQTKYTFNCMPLLDRDRSLEAAAALLDTLASTSANEWVIPTVNCEGGAARALIGALERRGSPWLFVGNFARAFLEASGTLDEHMRQHVSAKRRKDLERNRRRLQNLGRLEHESHHHGDGLSRAVASFLDIEAAGWKGKRGTALACDEETRRFALRAFTGDAESSICRADVLTLDGAAIAVSLAVMAGRTGYTVKCAYDENYRNYGAGLLLEVEVIRSFLAERWCERLDAATAGEHVIDDLWPGRCEVGDLMFSLSPYFASERLSAIGAAERLRRTVKATIRQELERIGLR